MDLPATFVDRRREIFPSDTPAPDAATRTAHGCDDSRRESLPDAVHG